MSKIDFSKAPNGATHYAVQTTGVVSWLMVKPDNDYFFASTCLAKDYVFTGWAPTATHINCKLFGSGLVMAIAPALTAEIPNAFSVPDGATHYADFRVEGRKFYRLEKDASSGDDAVKMWGIKDSDLQWVFLVRTRNPSHHVSGLKPLHELYRPWMPSDAVSDEISAFFAVLMMQADKTTKPEPPKLVPYTTTVKGDTLHAEFKIIPSHAGQTMTSCEALRMLDELCQPKQVE